MDEDISALFILDKPVPLFVVKPFDYTVCHCFYLLLKDSPFIPPEHRPGTSRPNNRLTTAKTAFNRGFHTLLHGMDALVFFP
ncbi:MAG: hypothetical protein ACOCW9_09360, partial [Thermodesulfobacteriota bacterium]